MIRSLVCLVGLAMLWIPPALADDGAITGVGGTIRLLDEHPSVALLGEHVHARLDLREETVEVECVFILANRGEADSILIGFPERCAGDAHPVPFSSFRSYIDGVEVTCARVPSDLAMPSGSLFWWTKRVFFASGQTRVIRDVYSAEAGFSIGFGPEPEVRTFDYALWTGSSWSGPIGAATVVFTVSPCDSTWSARYVSPVPTQRDKCEYRWHFSHFEPGSGASGTVSLAWFAPGRNGGR